MLLRKYTSDGVRLAPLLSGNRAHKSIQDESPVISLDISSRFGASILSLIPLLEVTSSPSFLDVCLYYFFCLEYLTYFSSFGQLLTLQVSA